jgi:tetratricopeptide (TPR) repeat protein
LYVYRVVRLRPGVMAAYQEGDALRKKSDFTRALAAFRRAAQLQGEDGSGPIYANIGACLVDLKRPREALANLEHSLRLDPDNAGARRAAESCRKGIGNSR